MTDRPKTDIASQVLAELAAELVADRPRMAARLTAVSDWLLGRCAPHMLEDWLGEREAYRDTMAALRKEEERE